MSEEWTLEKAIRVGLDVEKDAIKLYREAIEKVKDPSSKKMLSSIIDEKNEHLEFFEQALENPDDLVGYCMLPMEPPNYKITDNLQHGDLGKYSDFQEILIFAAQKEQEAHDFYLEMAEQFPESNVTFMFECFAREALFHKENLEKEYDRTVLEEL